MTRYFVLTYAMSVALTTHRWDNDRFIPTYVMSVAFSALRQWESRFKALKEMKWSKIVRELESSQRDRQGEDCGWPWDMQLCDTYVYVSVYDFEVKTSMCAHLRKIYKYVQYAYEHGYLYV